MDVDQHVVVHDDRFVMLDEADPAHVRGEVVHVLDAAVHRALAVLPAPQVEEHELVGGRGLEVRCFDIDSPHPVSLGPQRANEVVSDEAARTRHKHPH
jgi:hypothetical protein